MKNKENDEKMKLQEKSFIINEENINNFEFKSSHNYIYKNTFLTNFPYSIKNIIRIKQDSQGSFWINNILDRTNCYLDLIKNYDAFRCEEITEKELQLKEIYKSIKKYDIIYQFNKYIKIGKSSLCHYQIRKNLLQDKNYLIYNKKFCIEVYDIIRNRRQSLMSLDEFQYEKIICFDAFQNNEMFLICIGNNDGNSEIFSIKVKDFKECLKSKISNKTPIFTKNLNLVISQNQLNSFRINYNEEGEEDDNAELFINHVKFISDNKLITASNDCHFKIYDLYKNIAEQDYKNDFSINHCDINNDKNLLLCIGDSKSINLIDLNSLKKLNNINEHFDYGIVVKFNPYNNNYFASGNQDNGCKIWDIRMLDQGSILTSWGINDCISDLDWINSDLLCYMENSFFSHILDIKNNKIQDLNYLGYGNGIVHDKFNDNIYLNIFKGNDDDTGGIFCYERLKNRLFNSFNNINL